MAYTPPTYTPSGSLFGNATPSTPYTYGKLGNTTSAYNLWGSKGNPYIVNGPSYTPGAGAPITPQPVAPLTPINNNSGGDDSPIPDWVDPSTLSSSSTGTGFNDWGLQNWLGRNQTATRVGASLIGAPLLEPAINLAYGINPINNKSLNWYSGSTDFDNNVQTDQNLARDNYSGSLTAYQADKAAGMTDETWAERWEADKAAVVTQDVMNWQDANVDSYDSGMGDGSFDSSGPQAQEMMAENAEMFDSVEEAQEFYSDDGGSDDSGGGSYIATAATQALGKEGLDMFEGWRDYMHTAHPTFTTSYGRYRVTAPKIVEAIDKKTNSTELYQDIWNEYLKPIFNLIKVDMNNPKALSDYKVMVRELTNKYLKGDK